MDTSSVELTHSLVKSSLGALGQHPILQKQCFLELSLQSRSITHIDILRNFPNLMYINLDDNKLEDLSALSEVTGLMQLVARNNNVNGCLSFSAPHCKEGESWANGHTSVGSLLVSADLSGNKIVDMEGLEKRHPFLEFLLLGRNQIKEISSGISSMQFLKVLNLSYNSITSISGIEGNVMVQELNLEGNQIISLDGIGTLSRLSTLVISGNRLVSLAPLAKCSQLQFVDARNNQITFNRQAELLSNLQWLQTLMLEGNPCSFKPFYRQRIIYRLPILSKLDHTCVSADEKIRSCNLYNGGDESSSSSNNGGDLKNRKSVFETHFPGDDFILCTPAFDDDEANLQSLEIEAGIAI